MVCFLKYTIRIPQLLSKVKFKNRGPYDREWIMELELEGIQSRDYTVHMVLVIIQRKSTQRISLIYKKNLKGFLSQVLCP